MLCLAGTISEKLLVSSVCLPHSTKYSDPLISMYRFSVCIQHTKHAGHWNQWFRCNGLFILDACMLISNTRNPSRT